jgi:hypothetical protein
VSDPDAPPLDPEALIAALERHRVAFVAVGGLAAQWQGVERPTKDMDVCPAWDRDNLERLALALRDLGARLRVTGGPREGIAVSIEGGLLARMEVGTWRTNAGDIDILLGIPRDGRWDLARYEQLCERAVVVEAGGAKVLAASIEDIARSKEIANRPPDKEALPELRDLQARLKPEDDLDEERYR